MEKLGDYLPFKSATASEHSESDSSLERSMSQGHHSGKVAG